jgi:hypothetical protein
VKDINPRTLLLPQLRGAANTDRARDSGARAARNIEPAPKGRTAGDYWCAPTKPNSSPEQPYSQAPKKD